MSEDNKEDHKLDQLIELQKRTLEAMIANNKGLAELAIAFQALLEFIRNKK